MRSGSDAEPAETPERCPACEALSPERWRRATPSGLIGGVEASYELWRCRGCGTAVTFPRERDPLAEGLYETGVYAPPDGVLDLLLEPLRRIAERDRMRFLTLLEPGARVFEVGAGDGRFLSRLARRGYRVEGLEPAGDGTRAAGVQVRAVTVEEAGPPAAGPDAVIAWHVLEHLDDPAAALAKIRSWLGPGGILVLAVPNLASLQARLTGDRWFHQDVPRHRTHFTPRGLRAALRRTGFRPLRESHLLIEQNPLGMWQSLLNALTSERDVAFRVLKGDLSARAGRVSWRDLAVTVVAGFLLIPLATALELIAGLLGHGGSMVIQATPADLGRGDHLPGSPAASSTR